MLDFKSGLCSSIVIKVFLAVSLNFFFPFTFSVIYFKSRIFYFSHHLSKSKKFGAIFFC